MRDVVPSWMYSMLGAVALIACKKEPAREAPPAPAPAAAPAPAPAAPVAPASWYRSVIRAPDGTEVMFFLGIPAPGTTAGSAILRAGGHDVQSDASFDGSTLRVPMTVHQTALDGTITSDRTTLTGRFTTSWRAWGEVSLPLLGTLVPAPTPAALATIPAAITGAPVALDEPRTIWRVAMAESNTAKLVLEQVAPGDFQGLLQLETGNLIYLGGTGREHRIVLTGFDGTSGYRLELELDPEHRSARGSYVGGHRLDWRETLTAARVTDFTLETKPRGAAAGAKVGLPEHPALAALPPGPLLVELAGSWCSTCRNAAPFLVELYRDYHARGLQIVTLLYEFTDDPAVDARQAEIFKKSYNVSWPLVPVRGGPEVFADIMPTGVTGLDPSGFPITLFLRADRTLQAMHAGFPAADSPVEWKRVTTEFRSTIEQLLAR